MPIAKTIAIHKKRGVQRCMDYVHNEEKTGLPASYLKTESRDVQNALSYTFNTEKTELSEKEILVTGVGCSPLSASRDFALVQSRYYQKHGIPTINGKKIINPGEVKKGAEPKYGQKEERIAYHLIQSFESDQIDPKLINQIGVELVQAAFPGFQATVSTHMNTAHYHNHIVVNAYATDGSHKYKDNKESLMKVREISDRIALQYGLNVILDRSHSSIDWAEWHARQEGNSWKQQVKNDIDTVSQSVSSWEEFAETMRSAGYTLRETESYVTYTMPGSETRKVRDKTLGKEYSREELMRGWGELDHENKHGEHQSEVHLSSLTVPQHGKLRLNLYVSRYSELGRRRSELVMLLIRAIRILQQVKNYFRNTKREPLFQNNPIYHPASRKIEEMEDSLRALQVYGVGTEIELSAKLNEIGAALSHAKKECRLAEESEKGRTDLQDAIQSYLATANILAQLGLSDADLFPSEYTPRQIRQKNAALFPMSASQHRELFLAIDANQDFRLKYRFDEIDSNAASDIIAFLKGKTDKRPEAVISIEEYRRQHSPYPDDKKYSNDQKLQTDSKTEKAKKDALFLSLLSDYPEEEAQALMDHRMAMDFLAQAGISLSQLEQVLKQLDAEEQRQAELQKNMRSLSNDYRNLSRLKYAISLAKNPKYLFGPEYQEQSVEIEQKKPDIDTNQHQVPHQEPDVTTPNKNEPIYRNRDNYFEQEDDEPNR